MSAEYVSNCLRVAEYAARECGCVTCRKHYQSWLDWMASEEKTAKTQPPPKPPDENDDMGFSTLGYNGSNDKSPPIDSGHLWEWYMSGL